jgi:hypothetical protein
LVNGLDFLCFGRPVLGLRLRMGLWEKEGTRRTGFGEACGVKPRALTSEEDEGWKGGKFGEGLWSKGGRIKYSS